MLAAFRRVGESSVAWAWIAPGVAAAFAFLANGPADLVAQPVLVLHVNFGNLNSDRSYSSGQGTRHPQTDRPTKARTSPWA